MKKSMKVLLFAGVVSSLAWGSVMTSMADTAQETQAQETEAQAEENQAETGVYLTGAYDANGMWGDRMDKDSWGNDTNYVAASWDRWYRWASQKSDALQGNQPDDFWETDASIDTWAAEDTTGEGAAWKAQIDGYQVPMTLFDNFWSNRDAAITFRSQPGTELAKYDIWNTIVFVMWKNTDGMAVIQDANGSNSWTDATQFMTVNEDGSVTYTFYMGMMG